MGNSAVDKPRKIQLGQERVDFRKRIKTILLYVTISATAATHSSDRIWARDAMRSEMQMC